MTQLFSQQDVQRQEQKVDELADKLTKIFTVKQAQLAKVQALKTRLDAELRKLQNEAVRAPNVFSFEKKYAYALTSIVGRRPTNEDAHVVSGSCLAILDGHGGSECSREAAKLLESALQRAETGDVRTDLKLAILELDRKLVAHKDDGCTLACVTMQGGKFYLINCGDARVITDKHSTQDHKPSRPSEQERIQQYGGIVINGRVNAQLAVSRALGDFRFKTAGVVAEADVLEVDAENWVLLACDGLFDVISNEEAREAIKLIKSQKFQAPETVVQTILDCYQGTERQQQWEFGKWKSEEERISQAFVKAAFILDSTDNISVIFCQRK